MEKVLGAIGTLYSPATTPTQKSEADSWLKDFQSKPEAWMISDQILNSVSTSLEAKIFSSQTIRKKVERDLHDLDGHARLSLKSSLSTILQRFGSSSSQSRIIITQLCLSLACLAFQSPQWTDPVGDMFSRFSSALPAVLLEFLTVLPQQQQQQQHSFSDNSSLLSSETVHRVLNFCFSSLQTSFATGESELSCRLLKCCHSWLFQLSPELIQSYPIITVTFMALQSSALSAESEDLFDCAAELACDLLYLFSHHSASIRKNNSAEYGNNGGEEHSPDSYVRHSRFSSDDPICIALMKDIYQQLGTVVLPLCQKFASIPKHDADEDYHGKYKALTRIFVQAGETFMTFICRSPSELAAIVEGVLVCTSFPDLEVVPLTFGFWRDFTSDILLAYSQDKRQPSITPVIGSIYVRLMDVVIQHLRYPEDLSQMTSAERDDFRELRHVIGDVLKDCCLVIGQKECLSGVLVALNQSLAASSSSTRWQDVECRLFALRAVGSEVSNDESEIMPQIMGLLLKLPEHPKIQYATTLVIGRYSDWTNMHHEFIPLHLNFISRGFNSPEVVAASSLALKYLCQSCGKQMAPYLEQLHPFFLSVFQTFEKRDLKELAEAIAYIISAASDESLAGLFESFCRPIVQSLQAHVVTLHEDHSKKRIAEALEIYSIFVKTIIPKGNPVGHPCIQVFQQVWTTLAVILINGNYQEIHEIICRSLKNAVISYVNGLDNIIPKILEDLFMSFQKHKHTAVLWVSTYLIRSYSKNATLRPSVIGYYDNVMSFSFNLFGGNQFAHSEANPEDYEDFANFLMIGYENLPESTMRKECIENSIALFIFGISRPHPLLHETSVTALRVLFAEILDPKMSHEIPISAKSILESGAAERLLCSLIESITGMNSHGFLISGQFFQPISSVIISISRLIGAEGVFAIVKNMITSIRSQLASPQLVSDTHLNKFFTSFSNSIAAGEVLKMKSCFPTLVMAFRSARS